MGTKPRTDADYGISTLKEREKKIIGINGENSTNLGIGKIYKLL